MRDIQEAIVEPNNELFEEYRKRLIVQKLAYTLKQLPSTIRLDGAGIPTYVNPAPPADYIK